jgi:predicted chitinase
VFSVRGLFSGFDDDTALNIEVILLAMEDEKIIAWFDTIRQVFDIDEDGSFRGIIGELLDEQKPASDNKKLTFVAAVRIAESSLIKSPVPVLQTFTSSEYLPLSSIYGADIVPDADSWMVSSPVSYDGKILPARKSLLTLEEFKSIIPEAKDANLAKYLPYINETLEIYQINTKVRMAHFLCHIPVETGNLEFFKEINNTSKWKGRGLIHLTSESNYKGFAEFMKNPEIVKNPDLVATDPVHACHSAGWWWCKSTNVDTNTLADKEDFIGIVLKVNNLANGLQHRWEALKRAYAVFNLENREQRIAAMYAAMKNKGYRNV